jgi:predicted phage-related endonuclease
MTLPFTSAPVYPNEGNRRSFIGGSDARMIMGSDEAALARLWQEKRGEAEPPDYSDNLIVQLGVATEPLNRSWFERTTGQAIKDVQRWIRHPVIRWMAATLDGTVENTGAVFEAKFMLPWSFSEEAAAEKHMARSSTTCGSPMPGKRCSRSLPGAANGSRSR